MTYIRMTDDLKGSRDEVILRQGQLGILTQIANEGLKIIYFPGPGLIEVPDEAFRFLNDDDELRVVHIEHEDKEVCYTLTEDQFGTHIATIQGILNDVEELELAIPERTKHKFTLVFSKMTLKEIKEMPEYQP